jgi:hypothetical protein
MLPVSRPLEHTSTTFPLLKFDYSTKKLKEKIKVKGELYEEIK